MIKTKIKSVPNKLHVKTGDTVVVISGKIIVEGVNIKKKHLKPTQMNTQGQIVEREMPIFSSKVMLWDDSAKKGTRVKHKVVDGKKVRISVVSGKEI